jgi:hypothetical protein
MATFKPQYGSKTSITIGLNSLANGSVATSNTIDNSTNLFQDYLIEIVISGTAASTAWLDVRLLSSEDGTNFGTWENGIPLGTIDFSVNPQTAYFSVLNAMFQAPKYFKIAVRNNTGAALASSGNSLSVQGINIVLV